MLRPSSRGSRVSPGTERAPGPSGPGGTKDEILVSPTHPTPLASTVLGFPKGHPREDGPWVAHGILDLASVAHRSRKTPSARERTASERASGVSVSDHSMG